MQSTRSNNFLLKGITRSEIYLMTPMLWQQDHDGSNLVVPILIYGSRCQNELLRQKQPNLKILDLCSCICLALFLCVTFSPVFCLFKKTDFFIFICRLANYFKWVLILFHTMRSSCVLQKECS